MKRFSAGRSAVVLLALACAHAGADERRPTRGAGFDFAVARITVDEDAITARVTMISSYVAAPGRGSRPCKLTVVVRNSAGGIKDTLEAPIPALTSGDGVDVKVPITPALRRTLSGSKIEVTADAAQVNTDGNRSNNTKTAQVPALKGADRGSGGRGSASATPDAPKDPSQPSFDLALEDGSFENGRISWKVRNVDQVKPFKGVRTVRVSWSYKAGVHTMNQGEWMKQGVDDTPAGGTTEGWVMRPDLVKDAESYTYVIEMTPHDRNPDNDRLVLTDTPQKKPTPVRLD